MIIANNAPIGARAHRILQLVHMLPLIAGVAVAVYFLNWQGVVGGLVLFSVLAHLGEAIQRRLEARAALAAWGTYVDPGFTGKIKYKTTSKRAPRLTGRPDDDDDDIFMIKGWILADGAMLNCFKGKRFEATPDARYLAAELAAQCAEFTVYDQTEHVSYRYGEVDAPQVFAQLFSADRGVSAAALAAVLSRSQPTPLVAWRGLRLTEDWMLDWPDDVINKEIAPRLTLTATLLLPADCSKLEDPLETLIDPVRRLAVNGFATPFLCENLEDAIASVDMQCLIVKGRLIDDDYLFGEGRWYYRGQDGVWTTLDDELRDSDGKRAGRLLKIKSLTATSAVFEVDLLAGEAKGAYVQASSRAMPFKVVMDRAAVPPTCEVQIEKFT